MKICSLLASGENEGKIWNLLKPAVVNFLPTSVPVDESFPTRRIHFQDAPTLLKVHFRWSPLPLPPHFLNVPFDPCSNSCSNIFQIVYFFFFLFDRNTTLCRFKRNTNPRLDDYSTRFRCIEQQFSNFEAISFRNNISGKERKFYSSTCLETDRIDSRHETVSIDQFSHGWIGLYVDVYRDNTRFVMQPTSFVPPIFFDFQFFLSQTLIKGSFFFEIEGKQIRGTIYFIIIKEFTKRGFSFFFFKNNHTRVCALGPHPVPTHRSSRGSCTLFAGRVFLAISSNSLDPVIKFNDKGIAGWKISSPLFVD